MRTARERDAVQFPTSEIHSGHKRADALETDDVFECVNAPISRVSLADSDRSLDEAARLDDLIDERIAQLDYIATYAFRWNPAATKDRVGNLRNSLTRLSATLEKDVFDIAKLQRASPDLSFKEQDIP